MLRGLRDQSRELSEELPKWSWANLSFTDIDFQDTDDLANPSMIGSEIIAGSSNIKPIAKSNIRKHEHGPMKTSSVKSIPLQNDTVYPRKRTDSEDRLSMPPPSTYGRSMRELKHPNDDKFSMAQSKSKDSGIGSSSCNSKNPANNASANSVNSAKLTVTLYNWKVSLNDRGKLIIKGNIEGGKLVRSKPIKRHITPTELESVNNYIYKLQGSLVDQSERLPDYIRDTFINGFPHNWENVLQLWRDFVAKGSPVVYRWPTQVTDSDDDILSKVTDACNRDNRSCSSECDSPPPKFEDDSQLSNSAYSPINPNRRYNKTFDVHPQDEERSEIGEACGKRNFDKDNQSMDTLNNTNYIDNLKMGYKLCEYLREDKVKLIMPKLLAADCPQEYAKRIATLLSVINNIMSFETSDTVSNVKNVEHKNQNPIVDTPANKTTPKNIPTNPKTPGKKSAVGMQLRSHQTDDIVDESESETYGVPKMQAHLILQAQEYRCFREKRPRKKVKTKFPNNSGISSAEDSSNENQKVELEDKLCQKYGLRVTDSTNKKPMENTEQRSNVLKRRFSDMAESIPENAMEKPKTPEKKSIDFPSKKKREMPKIQSTESIAMNIKIISSERKNNAGESSTKTDFDNRRKVEGSNFKLELNTKEKSTPAKKNEVRQNKGHLYGSMKNPKLLRNWKPNLIPDESASLKWGLVFEGQLLNESSQVMNKKYCTDFIVYRKSAKLVQTSAGEYITLVGELSDKNHDVPKELLPKLRFGCPVDLHTFCRSWKIQKGKKNERPEQTRVDLNCSMSKRGRVLAPPSAFWEEYGTPKQNESSPAGRTRQTRQSRNFQVEKTTQNLKNDESKKNKDETLLKLNTRTRSSQGEKKQNQSSKKTEQASKDTKMFEITINKKSKLPEYVLSEYPDSEFDKH